MENEYKVLEKVMGIEIKYKIGAYKKGISSSSRQEAVKYIIKELEKVRIIITDNPAYENRDFLFSINRKVEVIDTLKGKDKERYIFTLLRPFAKYSEIAKGDVFKNILKGENLQVLEEQICYLVGIIEEYAIKLDAVLLERGINLLWYQEISGIYLIEERDKRDYIDYLGSEKLVQRYIDEALPKLEPQQAPEPTNTKPQQNKLPDELNTDEALKYFAKAKEIGLIDDNYKWLKGKQLLACFCREMSLKLDLGKGDRISWQPFEILFTIKKGSLRSNLNDIQKTGESPTDIYLVDKVFE